MSFSVKWEDTDHSGQFTPGSYLSAVIHTRLAGIEPSTVTVCTFRQRMAKCGLRNAE